MMVVLIHHLPRPRRFSGVWVPVNVSSWLHTTYKYVQCLLGQGAKTPAGAELTSVSSFANAAAVCTTGLRRLAYRMQQTPTVSWLQASAAAGACTSRARGLLQETLADVVSMLLHRGSVHLVGRGAACHASAAARGCNLADQPPMV